MKGKEFAEKYNELVDDHENYDICIGQLEKMDDQWRTDKSIGVIKEAQKKVKDQIEEFDNYKVIKE